MDFAEECTADRCSKVPCSHGGKCLTTGGDTAVCLCPLGYTGDLCETRVDLQVSEKYEPQHFLWNVIRNRRMSLDRYRVQETPFERAQTKSFRFSLYCIFVSFLFCLLFLLLILVEHTYLLTVCFLFCCKLKTQGLTLILRRDGVAWFNIVRRTQLYFHLVVSAARNNIDGRRHRCEMRPPGYAN